MSISKKIVRLEVRTKDEATEIYVIDGQFHLVDRGLGTLKTELTPGIYKVKVRAGFTDREDIVVLRPTDKEVIKEFPHLEFSSPVPLNDTARTHEYHIIAAASECKTPHVTVGHGSQVYIFVRDWTPSSRSTGSLPPLGPQHPARGLTLTDEQGAIVADCEKQSKTNLTEAQAQPGVDPWAACNVQLDPGLYRLKLEIPSGTVEQAIVAVKDWQTQVFLLQRNYGPASNPDERRADLSGGSILLSKLSIPSQFDPSSEQIRLTELARLGLTNQRQVLPKELLGQMLWAKYDNPMLGIYGAHLMLLGSEPDLNLLRTVVTNLRGLLGSHPDVEALALRLEGEIHSYVFKVPPMLRRSWSLVLEGTVKQPSMVPVDSFASEIATKIWGDDPWLLWMRPAEKPAAPWTPGTQGWERTLGEADDAAELTGYEQVLKAHLTSTGTGPPGSRALKGLESLLEYDSQDMAVAFSTPPDEFAADVSPSESKSVALPTSLDDSTAQGLVRVLGIPRGNVQGLLDKMNQES
jgi:hypothetical protein